MENNKPKIVGFIDLSANTGKVFGNKGAMRTSQKARERREAKIAEQKQIEYNKKREQELLTRCFNALTRK